MVIPSSHSRGWRCYHSSNENRQPPPTVTAIEPVDKLLATIRLFQKGLTRLKVDFLNSLHIQEAELTRLHLQRKERRSYERRRRRLRSHERHGVHVVDSSGREVAFLPSNSYTLFPKRKQRNSPDPANDARPATVGRSSYYGNYVSARRPQEHLRQMSRDLRTTLPTVAAFVLIPGVGYTFLLLGMMFPRLLLSRQFHTREQRRDFATKEHGERMAWWERLNGDFWGGCMRSMPGLILCQEDDCSYGKQIFDGQNDNVPCFLEPLSFVGLDTAGPVFDKQSMFTFYHLIQHLGGRNAATSERPSIKNLQTTHLYSLALANNLAAPMYLPSPISPSFLQTCVPSIYLQRKLETLAEDIIADDAALIEEGQLEERCSGMTDEEVLDACWLRGLPVGQFAKMNVADRSSLVVESEVHIMRNGLRHHLKMMEAVMMEHSSLPPSSQETEKGLRPKGELIRDGTLQLLILHLPAIRYSMMTR